MYWSRASYSFLFTLKGRRARVVDLVLVLLVELLALEERAEVLAPRAQHKFVRRNLLPLHHKLHIAQVLLVQVLLEVKLVG